MQNTFISLLGFSFFGIAIGYVVARFISKKVALVLALIMAVFAFFFYSFLSLLNVGDSVSGSSNEVPLHLIS
jgi:hypothetical protein